LQKTAMHAGASAMKAPPCSVSSAMRLRAAASATTTKCQGCSPRAVGAWRPALTMASSCSRETGSCLKVRVLWRLAIAVSASILESPSRLPLGASPSANRSLSSSVRTYS
jgi:hypothetical protein